MIIRVLAVLYSAFLLGGIGLLFASRRADQATRRARLIKFVTYFFIVNLFLFAALAGSSVFGVTIALICALGAREIYKLLPDASRGHAVIKWLIVAAYCVVSTGTILFAWNSTPAVIAFVFLVVCTFDGFSQVSGQLLGKHRLSPRVSPGKTIEGSLGGLVFGTAMGFLLRPAEWSAQRCLLICLLLAIASLAGDLLASLIKRRSNVKDYGSLIPGHGGILDRFDSFLFAAATYAAVFEVGKFFPQ